MKLTVLHTKTNRTIIYKYFLILYLINYSNECTKINNEYNKWKENLKSKDIELKEFQSNKWNLKDKITELNYEILHMTRKLANLMVENMNLRVSNFKLNSDKTANDMNNDQNLIIISQYQSKISSLKIELSCMVNEISELKRKIDKLNNKNDELKTATDELKSKNDELKTVIDELKSKINEQSSLLNIKKIESIEYENKIDIFKLEIDYLKDKYADQELNFNELICNQNHLELKWDIYSEMYSSLIYKINNILDWPITLDRLVNPIILPSGVTIEEYCFDKLINKKDPYDKNLIVKNKIYNRIAKNINEIIKQSDLAIYEKEKKIK